MTFTIPVRTVSESNAREHWRARQRRAKAQRLAAFAALRPASLLLRAPLPCVVTLSRVAPRALDGDNLQGALKHVRDQVAAEIGVDDRDPRVEWRYAQERGAPREYAVRVEIDGRMPPRDVDDRKPLTRAESAKEEK